MRFAFGENWVRYSALIDQSRIVTAEQSLKCMLEIETLNGMKFLDIGSGSGIFSLAARNLGAEVYSFDYDIDSVACTEALKARYYPEDTYWAVERGDVLDSDYMNVFGEFDIVYSWGVLHHTGDMWRALDNVVPAVRSNGVLFIALYNDQRWLSRYWWFVKRVYNISALGRLAAVVVHAPYFLVRQGVKRVIKPSSWDKRGMNAWRDIIDWLGGYPFEVARPEAVLAFFRAREFTLERMTTVDSRHGCNEYIYRCSSNQA